MILHKPQQQIMLKEWRRRFRKLLLLNEECESAQTYISELEMGKKSPSLLMVERIASALGIEAVNLFKDEAAPGGRKNLSHTQKQEMADRMHRALAKIIEDYQALYPLAAIRGLAFGAWAGLPYVPSQLCKNYHCYLFTQSRQR